LTFVDAGAVGRVAHPRSEHSRQRRQGPRDLSSRRGWLTARYSSAAPTSAIEWE
jgi:hypothetical protein